MKSHTVLIELKEAKESFEIDCSAETKLVEILEMIYDGQYFNDFNVSEPCGFIYKEKLYSERNMLVFSIIQNDTEKLEFVRGEKFNEKRKKDQQTKPDQNTHKIIIESQVDQNQAIPINQKSQLIVEPKAQQIEQDNKKAENGHSESNIQQSSQLGQYASSQSKIKVSAKSSDSQLINETQSFQSNIEQKHQSTVEHRNAPLDFCLYYQPDAITLEINSLNAKSHLFLIEYQDKTVQDLKNRFKISQDFDELSDIKFYDYKYDAVEESQVLKLNEFFRIVLVPQGFTIGKLVLDLKINKTYLKCQDVIICAVGSSPAEKFQKILHSRFDIKDQELREVGIQETQNYIEKVSLKNHEDHPPQTRRYVILYKKAVKINEFSSALTYDKKTVFRYFSLPESEEFTIEAC